MLPPSYPDAGSGATLPFSEGVFERDPTSRAMLGLVASGRFFRSHPAMKRLGWLLNDVTVASDGTITIEVERASVVGELRFDDGGRPLRSFRERAPGTPDRTLHEQMLLMAELLDYVAGTLQQPSKQKPGIKRLFETPEEFLESLDKALAKIRPSRTRRPPKFVERVAEEMGIARATWYGYYGDKDFLGEHYPVDVYERYRRVHGL